MIRITIKNPKNPDDYYTISSSDQTGNIWIKHCDGEGMGMNVQQVFDYLDKWFKDTM